MLTINVPITPEIWDEEKGEFIEQVFVTLRLEHSLASIKQWESKWHKPFFLDEPKTSEEIFDYIKYMTLTENVDPNIFGYLTEENVKEINAYIEDPMTATTFSKDQKKRNSREKITAELVYYWMISLQIPMECQYWHINQLLTLVQVCNIKNTPPKKRGRQETINHYAEMNAKRRAAMKSKG